VVANSSADCASLIGPECDRVAGLESARLLRHEQTHFDIACAIVNKADDALGAGSALKDVRKAVKDKGDKAQKDYDTQTNHGCNAGPQAAWEADVAAGLPRIVIP
jgi:hypothetical protein